jgi:phosphatidylglycerophosphatase GEP4
MNNLPFPNNTNQYNFQETFNALLSHYSPTNILIVSNSSGLFSKDSTGNAADILERNTGVKVLRHAVAKPGCSDEIMSWFRMQSASGHGEEKGGQKGSGVAGEAGKGMEVTSPSQICVIGDRLFTDVVMANMMGARAIWIKEGAVKDHGIVTRVEYWVEAWLRQRGWRPREV